MHHPQEMQAPMGSVPRSGYEAGNEFFKRGQIIMRRISVYGGKYYRSGLIGRDGEVTGRNTRRNSANIM